MVEDTDIDFDGLVEAVRTQSADAAGSDTERVRIRSFESVDLDALDELRAALADEDVERGALTFFVSESNADRLLDGADADDVSDLEARVGHDVCVAGTVPDDAILFADPDAVDGAEIRDPTAVALGEVGKAT